VTHPGASGVFQSSPIFDTDAFLIVAVAQGNTVNFCNETYSTLISTSEGGAVNKPDELRGFAIRDGLRDALKVTFHAPIMADLGSAQTFTLDPQPVL
jgi:hypothetical protein